MFDFIYCYTSRFPLCYSQFFLSLCVTKCQSKRENLFRQEASPNNLLQAVSILFEEPCLLSIDSLSSLPPERHREDDECSVKQIYRYNVDIEWRSGFFSL